MKPNWKIFLIVGLVAIGYLLSPLFPLSVGVEDPTLDYLPSQGKIPDDTTGIKNPTDTVWAK